MLEISIELVTDTEAVGRQLGVGYIADITGGPRANYECTFDEGKFIKTATVLGYQRHRGTVWDLVAHAIDKAPDRAHAPPGTAGRTGSPIRRYQLYTHIGIPEPTRAVFERNMAHSTCPVFKGELFGDCAYVWDWTAFIGGER